MVRSTRGLLAIVLLAVTLSSCSVTPQPSQPMRIIVPIWMGFTPLYAAESQKFYGSTPITINSVGSLYDANRAFAQGRADVLATTMFDALRMADSGVPIKIILISDFSTGADAIVARPGIKSMSELKGKRVAVEVGTLAHFFLISALNQSGVQISDVEIVNLAAEDAVQALQNGKVDAIEIWEPYISQLTNSGQGTKLFSTAELPGLFADVLVVRKDFAEQRAADITNLIAGWGKATQAWQNQPDNVLPTMAKAVDTTPEQFQIDIQTIQILDLQQNQQIFDPAHPQSVWKAYDETAGFLSTHDFLKNTPPAATAILDVQFINQAIAR